jgi:hypothetical protein
MAKHRKTKRGGAWWNPFSWGKPAQSASMGLTDTTKEVAPLAASAVGTPAEQAAALGTASPSSPSMAPSGEALGPTAGRRKHRKTHRRSRKHRSRKH